MNTDPMTMTSARIRASSRAKPLALGTLAAGMTLWLVSLAVSIHGNGLVTDLLDRQDALALERSERAFNSMVDQKLIQLESEAAVLAEDARVRSTVVTPQFDPESAADILAELKKSAKADVVAILDADGRVRAVTGADEMKNLDLSTSSLVKTGLEKPSAHIWTFTNQVRLLGVAPVQLGGQVIAMFMLGFDLDPASLADIGGSLGAMGGAFVGDSLVASSSAEPSARALLQSAASNDSGMHAFAHQGGAFVARNFRPKQSAGAMQMVWVVAKHHAQAELRSLRWFVWAPVSLVGLSFLLLSGLAFRSRAATR